MTVVNCITFTHTLGLKMKLIRLTDTVAFNISFRCIKSPITQLISLIRITVLRDRCKHNIEFWLQIEKHYKCAYRLLVFNLMVLCMNILSSYYCYMCRCAGLF